MGLRNSITSAMRAPFMVRGGQQSDISDIDRSYDPGYAVLWRNSADTADIVGFGVDTDGIPRIGDAAVRPGRLQKTFYIAANATLATQTFFIADKPYIITGIQEVHKTAGNDAAAVTLEVFRDTGTQAPGAGATTMSGSFNMKGTASTVQTATLANSFTCESVAQNQTIFLNTGDRLSAVFTGVLTTLAGVAVTVTFAPGYKGEVAIYSMNANGSLADQAFFVANQNLTITGVSVIWSAAGTNGSAVTIDVKKDTGTTAPAGGTTVLAAALSVKTTANTVANPALSATASVLSMAAGDRLSVDFTGTLTALAGVVVVVAFAPIYSAINVTYQLLANASLGTDTAFFTADRDYEVLEISGVWSVVGGSGALVTVTRDIGTNAPGAGTSLLTDNTNTGFDLTTTVNTVNYGGLPTSRHSRLLAAGDRLSTKNAGTKGTLAGLIVAVTLRPF